MKTIYNISLCLLLSFTTSVFAQQKIEKLSQSINTSKTVNIDLNTSHTNIEVETWNKDYIEIEAFVESSKLSKEELQELVDSWNLDIDGSSTHVEITSMANSGSWTDDISLKIFDEQSLEALANIKDLEINLQPLLKNLENMESLSSFKELPDYFQILRLPKSPDGNYNLDFDFDKYKKDGDAYLDSWSKKYRTEYGETYEKEMRDWAKSIKQSDIDKFEKDMEAWGEKFGEEFSKSIEDSFGKDFEKEMEKWGEDFGKNFEKAFGKDFEARMEAWGENFGKNIENHLEGLFDNSSNHSNQNNLFNGSKNYDAIKTIKLKIPKKAKLNLNVKHGELKLASLINNIKADIAYSKFTAKSINGGNTSINTSYSTVFINDWQSGELKLNYADKALLNNVTDIMLSSNSSNVKIDNIKGQAIIDGSFGDLSIQNILDSFTNLNIVLENSNALLTLPKGDYSLFFKGNKSKYNGESTSSKIINNQPNGNKSKSIIINSKYSKVVTK